MTQAKTGDTVRVHYIGTFDDGTLFDSSREHDEPFEVTLGNGDLIPSFEKGLEGMRVGEKKTIRIPAADAYGEYQPHMVQQFDRSEIQTEEELKVGMEIQAETDDGRNSFVLVVTELNGDKVTLDGNHPLAGKDLNFELELIGINP